MSSIKNLSIIVLLCLIFAVVFSVDETQFQELEASKKYCASLKMIDCIWNELHTFTCIWLNGKCEVY